MKYYTLRNALYYIEKIETAAGTGDRGDDGEINFSYLCGQATGAIYDKVINIEY